jgi:hypothetical protein
MARLFDAAHTEFFELDSAPLTTYPISMACWFWADTITVNYTLMGLFDASAFNQFLLLQASGFVGSDPVRAVTNSTAGGFQSANTSGGFSSGAWHHAGAVFDSSSVMAAYLDGANKGTGNPGGTPTGIDRVSLGHSGDSSPGAELAGRLGMPALWSTALSDANMVSLAAGVHPTSIEPGSLAAVWSLGACGETEIDGGPAYDSFSTHDLTAFSDAVGPDIIADPPGLVCGGGTRNLLGLNQTNLLRGKVA